MHITGTSGNDTLSGTSANDVFDMSQGGADAVSGGDGNDVFNFGAALTAADKIDGGSGTDALRIDGDYSAGVVFTATTMVNVEKLEVGAGHSYLIEGIDLAAGAKLSVSGAVLSAGNVLNFEGDGAGRYAITGGAGNDILDGGTGNDTINAGAGDDFIRAGSGNNTINGGDGNDIVGFLSGEVFSVNDKIDGGSGSDVMNLFGIYNNPLVFKAATITNLESIKLNGGSFNITTNDANVAAAQTLTVDASLLSRDHVLSFHGANETDGSFIILGGQGADRIIGGAGNDQITGGAGADKMAGGGGIDTFIFNAVTESTGSNCDHITDFDAAMDRLHFSPAVAGVDAQVSGGTLTTINFTTDLTTAIGATQLHANDAVIFAPTAGNLHGHVYLIVDANGAAGFQAGADYVVEMTGMTGTLALSNFS